MSLHACKLSKTAATRQNKKHISPVSSNKHFLSVRVMANLQDSYDYVVCGGGSAGCVVAARLSEDPNRNVLLLEAGPSDLDWIDTHTPALVGSLQRTKVDWDYKCKIQEKSYLAYEDVTWTRGKVLGGCSSHNFMVFTRCSAADYDSWAKLGCEGWSWKDVLPFFLKTENGIW
ncbi:uncharacterized protein [Amphiura filiformis]|uniref:uncharacterized protein n=1 Tax=Amphiura filiformis TaxID=82378 RepID=UPI003B214F11